MHHELPKINLNLNQDNDLVFEIAIDGTDSALINVKWKIRFVLSLGEKHWLYHAEKRDDGFVHVTIPNDKIFKENHTYLGQLEVIIGNHYFVPAEVEIEFLNPVKIEASIASLPSLNKTNVIVSERQNANVSLTGMEVKQTKKKKRSDEVS